MQGLIGGIPATWSILGITDFYSFQIYMNNLYKKKRQEV